MQITLISDIHGNLAALDAVLSSPDVQQSEEIVCLGDVAVFGPQPREVVARLRALDCPVAMGNTDAWLLNPSSHQERDEHSRRMTEVEMWSARQLSPSDLDHVRTFQSIVEQPLGAEMSLLCFHGSPRSWGEIIVSTTSDIELSAMLSGFQATVMAGGHSHAQMLRRFGDVTLINPGSVGLPYERILSTGAERRPPWAEFSIVRVDGERLAVEFRRIPYDVNLAIQAALSSGMPHAEWWSSQWEKE